MEPSSNLTSSSRSPFSSRKGVVFRVVMNGNDRKDKNKTRGRSRRNNNNNNNKNTRGEAETFRSRRSHTKSRAGCKNCKNRRVKCDEGRPECDKCQAFGVTCDYRFDTAVRTQGAILPVRESEGQAGLWYAQFTMSVSLAASSLNHLLEPGDQNTEVGDMSILDALTASTVDVQVLHHFFSETCYTVGSPLAQEVARSDVLKIALEKPYLMHSVLAMSAAHRRRLEPDQQTLRLAEIYHWQQATVLFRRVIGNPLRVDEMDAMFSTCMLLAALSFHSETFDPANSFIFSADPNALNWLKQQSGLRGLLAELEAYIANSVWTPVFDESDDGSDTFCDERPGPAGLPPAFVDLCGIDETSTVDNNPYHAPLRLLTPLISLRQGIESFGKRISFTGRLQPQFFDLLLRKDPSALLMMGYWFAGMIALGQWWYHDRVLSECTAICMYLDELDDPRISPLLEAPARACGYVLRRHGQS